MMEALHARLASFAKAKRTKQGSSKSSGLLKWPHPPTYKATPDTLAEAGFYFHPTSEYRDNVICFMCGKELSDWDEDDDPFSIHWTKCRNTCAWAVVRCGLIEDLDRRGNFTFQEETRLPTSTTMEKARLDTFVASKLWPHDAVRGHGANSKKMAKAGFVYTPQAAGDDTATCLYCNLSLSGWDDGDDPMDEHLKRESKSGTPCPFFQSPNRQALGKSTSKPPSKTASKPPSRSNSQSKTKPEIDEGGASGSDDELAARRRSRARPSKAPSREGSRASSATSKTPASRRSTRTGTTGKTPTSHHTTGSEQEDTEAGSGSDAGKRVSKSKRKAGGKGKSRPTVIAEEDEDVLIPDAMEERVEEPAPKEKPRRGRPPKAPPKPTKPNVAEDGDTDIEAAPAKETHARTRSRTNVLASEPDEPVPSSSKPTHARTKSTSKAKEKLAQSQPREVAEMRPFVEIPLSRQQEPIARPVLNDEPPAKSSAQPKLLKPPRAKSKKMMESSDVDMVPIDQGEPDVPEVATDRPPSRTKTKVHNRISAKPSAQEPPRPSTSSEDPGYVTAEPPLERAPQSAGLGHRTPMSTTDTLDVDMDVIMAEPPTRTRPPSNSGTRFSSEPKPGSAIIRRTVGAHMSSRSNSAEDPLSSGRQADQGKLKVVDISSDEEEQARRPSSHKRPAPSRVAPSSSKSHLDVPAAAPITGLAKAQSRPLETPTPTPPERSQGHANDTRDAVQDIEMHNDDTEQPKATQVTVPSTPPSNPMLALPSTPPARITLAEMDDASGKVEEPHPAASIVPLMSQLPLHKLDSLTEEESAMTIEQYLRREIERQYVQFKEDGERRIADVQAAAVEIKRRIEAL
ncbi:hypothetical protein OBBRIDRAFT_832707 [Obba rivulosa]|uniref:BIR-domain-containing protein n=1 Tax=Obba rivulosa TaxID=1052685 RepID=A0A8E2DPE3_9APHY|nr:hypothetical protein OBBRIDRAFT_832707 [Obba rivulosa]